MKKKVSAALLFVIMMFCFLPMGACAQGIGGSGKEASDVISQVKQHLSAAFESMDSQTAEEVFSFLKEKVQDSSLGSEEGILNAIKEGKEKFGVEIDRDKARELVDAMEKLEKMGFSAEYVLDKTQSLYQEYGTDFADHMDEVITGAVKNAASNAVGSFFDNLKNSVKSFFSNLFS